MSSNTSDSDEALLARFGAKGDRDALAELAARYEPALLGLAHALLGQRSDLAADAVQETWVRVIRHAAGFGGRSSVKTWLYRILINRASEIRAACLRQSAIAERAASNGHGAGAGSPHGLSRELRPGPDGSAALLAALESLGDGARLVVILCYHRGLSHAQVAEVLDIPMGTVKSRLAAALAALRERVGEEVRP